MAGRLGGAKVGGGGEHGTALGLSIGAIQLVVAKRLKGRNEWMRTLIFLVECLFYQNVSEFH